MTQEQRILQHFENKSTLTSLEAWKNYGVARLASVINVLRKRGVKIESIRADGFNKFGERTHWTIYKIVKDKEQE